MKTRDPEEISSKHGRDQGTNPIRQGILTSHDVVRGNVPVARGFVN